MWVSLARPIFVFYRTIYTLNVCPKYIEIVLCTAAGYFINFTCLCQWWNSLLRQESEHHRIFLLCLYTTQMPFVKWFRCCTTCQHLWWYSSFLTQNNPWNIVSLWWHTPQLNSSRICQTIAINGKLFLSKFTYTETYFLPNNRNLMF